MITSEFKVFHDPDWKKFLQALPNQEAKGIAGMTMDWIKGMYAPVVNRHWGIVKKMDALQDALENSLNKGLKGSPDGYVEVMNFHKVLINKIQILQEEIVEAMSGTLVSSSIKEG